MTIDLSESFRLTTPGERDIVMTRDLAAPPAIVFAAFTTPAHVRAWYGPEGTQMTVCEIDLRLGGRWRFVSRCRGMEVAFNGEYREIDPPRRLVQSEIYEAMPDVETMVTLDLAQRGAGAAMTVTIRHPSAQSRDGQLASGMEWGVRQSYDRLDALTRTLAAASSPQQHRMESDR